MTDKTPRSPGGDLPGRQWHAEGDNQSRNNVSGDPDKRNHNPTQQVPFRRAKRRYPSPSDPRRRSSKQARQGTNIHFDVKDYPVIMFRNMKELRERIAKRLRAIAEKQH